MKIVVTGSLGNMSLPLAKILLSQGHEVIIVSSNANKEGEIRSLGGIPAIGSLEDADFIARTFENADGVYCMVPPSHELDQVAYYGRIGQSFVKAIQQNNIGNVVFLSSWGADKAAGTGPILGSHKVEELFKPLGQQASVTYLRATSLMYNLYGFADMIKHAGFIGTNYGGDDMISWVHPQDIAEAAAEVLLKTPEQLQKGIHIRYVASDDMTAQESAQVIGTAINKPDLEWKLLPREAVESALVSNAGMAPEFAALIADLNQSIHTGALGEDYFRNKPAPGKHKLAEFAQEFAKQYQQG